MKIILKYPLTSTRNVLSLPNLSKVVMVGEQTGGLHIWVEVNTKENVTREDRVFYVAGTGQDILPDLHHVGSVIMQASGLVWHVYEDKS